MALIDQQKAAKQIRGNKEWLADCQWLKGFNDACEQAAQIVEKIKGQEIIHCKECIYKKICSWKNQGAEFCSFGERGKQDG